MMHGPKNIIFNSYVCFVLYNNTGSKNIYVYGVVIRTQNTLRYVSIYIAAVM